MNENEPRPEPHPGAPLDDDVLGRLIRDAGPRAPIRREDLDAIAAAARAAVAGRVETRAERDHAAPVAPQFGGGPVRDRSSARRAATIALALAAAVAALLLGVRVWRRAPGTSAPAAPIAVVATVEIASGPLRAEIAGAEHSLEAGERVPAGAVIRTPPLVSGGGSPSAALRLESGALVRIDGGAALRLASANRLELLAGALYAETATAPARRSLEIETAAGTVRDLGTRFLVVLRAGARDLPEAPGTAGAGASELEVRVRDGAVAVARGRASAVAHRGERIVVHGDGAIEQSATPVFGPEWAWVMDAAPSFDVTGRSIADILDWVSRETGWTVRYQDDALAAAARGMVQQSSGSRPPALRADQAPFVLLPGANLECTLADGVLTVRRR